ncbi:type VI secretion system-associated protein TagF (plasmid) [Ralstonia sp. R-29]|uniref:type VI secretion system-associated protein TagF n=1 Tax=Ralstonia sp. R-29 TaxID=3404059 RepID=UPI003CF5F1CC
MCFDDGDTLPAWYGKIPGSGDFVNRRLPQALANWWERWLQQGMSAMRQRGDGEIERYYTVAPVWNFLIPAGAGTHWVQPGCLAPSCDRVGRYYPVVVTLPMRVSDYRRELPDVADPFYWHVGTTLLDAILHARAPEHLEQALAQARLCADTGVAARNGEGARVLAEPVTPIAPIGWPGLSQYFDPYGATSFWWTNRADGSALRTLAHTGVPDAGFFLRLFGPQSGT